MKDTKDIYDIYDSIISVDMYILRYLLTSPSISPLTCITSTTSITPTRPNSSQFTIHYIALHCITSYHTPSTKYPLPTSQKTTPKEKRKKEKGNKKWTYPLFPSSSPLFPFSTLNLCLSLPLFLFNSFYCLILSFFPSFFSSPSFSSSPFLHYIFSLFT